MTAPAYTGVGARATPRDQLQRLRDLGALLAREGYELRSGAADGADTAFEEGCDLAGGAKSIWLPWPGFQNRWPDPARRTFPTHPRAFEIAARVHPRWPLLTRGPRALHARNMHEVLGHTLDAPSDFTVCWTLDGAQSAREVTSTTGGTGTAIRLSSERGVPIFNLAREGAEEALFAFLAQRRAERLAAPGLADPAAHEDAEEEGDVDQDEPDGPRNILRFPTR